MRIWGEEVPSIWVVSLSKQNLLKSYYQAFFFFFFFEQDVYPGMPVLLLQVLVALPEICGEETNRAMWVAKDLLQHKAWSCQNYENR